MAYITRRPTDGRIATAININTIIYKVCYVEECVLMFILEEKYLLTRKPTYVNLSFLRRK